MKKIMVIISLLLIALGGFQLAEAKRFGGGGNFGASRAAPTQNNTANATRNTQNTANKGSMLGRILSIAAIAALMAWLFSAQGLMGILLLALIVFALVMFMRRRAMSMQNGFNQANDNRHSQASTPFSAFQSAQTTETATESQANYTIAKDGLLPDGTPETVLTHQSLNLFKQLQNLNNAENLEKVRGYLTAEMFDQVKDTITTNTEIAEFDNLNAKVIDFEKTDSQSIASVMFVGLVKEDGQWNSFEEVWHFVRGHDEHIWQVAGIQQF